MRFYEYSRAVDGLCKNNRWYRSLVWAKVCYCNNNKFIVNIFEWLYIPLRKKWYFPGLGWPCRRKNLPLSVKKDIEVFFWKIDRQAKIAYRKHSKFIGSAFTAPNSINFRYSIPLPHSQISIRRSGDLEQTNDIISIFATK